MLQDILLIVIGLIVGAVIGFFVCRKYMEKESRNDLYNRFKKVA